VVWVDPKTLPRIGLDPSPSCTDGQCGTVDWTIPMPDELKVQLGWDSVPRVDQLVFMNSMSHVYRDSNLDHEV
jgi:hypothetical protein